MREHLLPAVLATVVFGVSSFGSWAQTAKSPDDALLDVLVWGVHQSIDLKAYPPQVGAELEKVVQQSQTYRSQRREPLNSPELKMVHAALVRYERMLVAVAADANAQAIAFEYVDRLRPCYEWEGYHDCPEREAVFAAKYSAANPRGPFNEYLPLLAAHRWLCAAEAYDYEKRPRDAARSRRAYEEAISVARGSSALLIRAAAEALQRRGQCRFQG
jgi:hypothetical protein